MSNITNMSTTDSSYVDSLQLAVPYAGLASLAIAAEAKEKGEVYRNSLSQFLALWLELGAFVEDGTVLALGLCDVETDTLREIYDKSEKKPTSITVTLGPTWPRPSTYCLLRSSIWLPAVLCRRSCSCSPRRTTSSC
jgi:diketogulonate reductase-like aldo/keto reductase